MFDDDKEEKPKSVPPQKPASQKKIVEVKPIYVHTDSVMKTPSVPVPTTPQIKQTSITTTSAPKVPQLATKKGSLTIISESKTTMVGSLTYQSAAFPEKKDGKNVYLQFANTHDIHVEHIKSEKEYHKKIIEDKDGNKTTLDGPLHTIKVIIGGWIGDSNKREGYRTLAAAMDIDELIREHIMSIIEKGKVTYTVIDPAGGRSIPVTIPVKEEDIKVVDNPDGTRGYRFTNTKVQKAHLSYINNKIKYAIETCETRAHKRIIDSFLQGLVPSNESDKFIISNMKTE